MPNHTKQIQATNLRIQQLEEGIPAIMKQFREMQLTAYTPVASSTKTQALIGIGIATAIRCVGCINYHVSQAILFNATREEVMDAVQIAILMGGGPSVHYGAEVLSAYDELKNASAQESDH